MSRQLSDINSELQERASDNMSKAFTKWIKDNPTLWIKDNDSITYDQLYVNESVNEDQNE